MELPPDVGSSASSAMDVEMPANVESLPCQSETSDFVSEGGLPTFLFKACLNSI
jgi:hypothetical protein